MSQTCLCQWTLYCLRLNNNAEYNEWISPKSFECQNKPQKIKKQRSIFEPVVFAARLFLLNEWRFDSCDVAGNFLPSSLQAPLSNASFRLSANIHLRPQMLLIFTLPSVSPPRRFWQIGLTGGKKKGLQICQKTMARPACFSALFEPQTSSFCLSDLGRLCKSTLAALAGGPRDDLTNMVTLPAKEREKRNGECEKCFNWSRNLDSFRWDPFEKCAGNRMRWRSGARPAG